MDTQEKRNLAIVKWVYEGPRPRNEEELKSHLHPDVILYEAESLPFGGLYKGKDGKIIEVRPFYWDTKRACEVYGD